MSSFEAEKSIESISNPDAVQASDVGGRPRGLWQCYVGADANLADQGAVAAALCGGMLMGSLPLDVDLVALTVLSVLGADVCGGLVAHLRGPAARQVRANGRGLVGHTAWVFGHLLQYVAFVWLFREADPARIVAVGAAMLVGAVVVLRAEPAMQRRVGLAVTCVSLVFVDATVGLQGTAGWFLPLLLAKIFVAYLPTPEGEPEAAADEEARLTG